MRSRSSRWGWMRWAAVLQSRIALELHIGCECRAYRAYLTIGSAEERAAARQAIVVADTPGSGVRQELIRNHRL